MRNEGGIRAQTSPSPASTHLVSLDLRRLTGIATRSSEAYPTLNQGLCLRQSRATCSGNLYSVFQGSRGGPVVRPQGGAREGTTPREPGASRGSERGGCSGGGGAALSAGQGCEAARPLAGADAATGGERPEAPGVECPPVFVYHVQVLTWASVGHCTPALARAPQSRTTRLRRASGWTLSYSSILSGDGGLW